MKRVARIAVVATGLLVAGSAVADETGFSDMHAQRREGGRICMTDHFHYGSSSGYPSRKQAEIQAIKDWQGFTAFEYGTTWGRYNIAASREMTCEQGSGGWGCNVSARPCKPARGASAARRN